jgi:hypothetical protein
MILTILTKRMQVLVGDRLSIAYYVKWGEKRAFTVQMCLEAKILDQY